MRYLLAALAATAVGLAYTSSQSFWMDEGGTIFKAMMPTLAEWWKMLLHLKGSDVLMPLYMIYMWFWHHALGATSEYALRLSNLPWLVLAVVVLARVRFWPLVCLISPFVLYFVDELRAYTMQIAAGACAAAALGRWLKSDAKNDFRGVHALCAACLFLIVSSMTSAVWAAGVAAGAVITRPDCLRNAGFWLRAAPWLLAALGAGGYYGYMMQSGYRATEIENAGLLNVLFGVYEMTGLLGLGPGKEEVRVSLKAVIPHLWLLVPGTAIIGSAWLCGLLAWARTAPPRHLIGAVAAVLLPLALLTLAGTAMDFRVLGRHLSPAIPAILLPIAACLQTGLNGRKPALFLGAAACLLMFVSALNVRLNERHAKDDYRKATAIVIESLQNGKRVWWLADMNATRYYAYRAGGYPMVHRIQELESDPPTSPMFADVIIVNRPDLRFRYMEQGYEAYLKHHFFKLTDRFPGFEVWKAE